MCREGQGLTSIIAAPPSHFIAGIDGGAPHQVKKVFLSFHPRSTVTASSTPQSYHSKNRRENFEIRNTLNYGFVFP
jgi:hypothetical protein